MGAYSGVSDGKRLRDICVVYLRGLKQRWNVPTCGLQIDANRRLMELGDLLKLRDDLVALDRVQDIEGN